MDFEEFWKGYPRKHVKKPSRDQWNKLNEHQQQQAIDALPNHIAMWESEGREAHMIPHARTWLYQERWEDEIKIGLIPPKQAVAWWASEAGILAKGRELGIHARGGESMSEFKARVVEAARKAA